MRHPTENDVVDAAWEVVKGAQVPVLGSLPPALETLQAVVYNRWIFAMTVGQVLSQLRADQQASGVTSKRINGWALTTSAWVPSKVKSGKGATQTPNAGFTPGFDDAVGSVQQPQQYKIAVAGVLKVWQCVEFDLGNNDVNSERKARNERGAVIDAFSASPRFGLNWFNFEHEELKMPNIALLPFGDSLLHIAQGNVPFSFEYVVNATT